MLRLLDSRKKLHFDQLMQVYAEDDRENGGEQDQLLAEQDFYRYLMDVFFATSGALYAVWEVDGRYVSALRLEPYRDGLLIEGLQTAPAERRKGYAKALLMAVREYTAGSKLYSHVDKRNFPSLALHEDCGFWRIRENAVYIDGSVDSRCCTLCSEP